jgi:hypothetical protein
VAREDLISEHPEPRTISTPELRALMEGSDYGVRTVVSLTAGEAEVQLVTPDGRRCTVTVVDPEPT